MNRKLAKNYAYKTIKPCLLFRLSAARYLRSHIGEKCRKVLQRAQGRTQICYSYIRVLPDYFLLKSIVFKVCEHKCRNNYAPDYLSAYNPTRVVSMFTTCTSTFCNLKTGSKTAYFLLKCPIFSFCQLSVDISGFR